MSEIHLKCESFLLETFLSDLPASTGEIQGPNLTPWLCCGIEATLQYTEFVEKLTGEVPQVLEENWRRNKMPVFFLLVLLNGVPK